MFRSDMFEYRLCEDIGQALVELDRSLRIVTCNRRFQEVFSEGGHVEPGTPLTAIVPDKLLETAIRLGLEPDDGKGDVEITWPAVKGERRQFLASVSPASPYGETVVVLFYEVTEWMRRQRRLMEESRLVSVGEMVAGAAHEINNPLAAIMGLAQLGLRQEAPASIGRDLKNILEQAKRAAEVVANLGIFCGVPRPRKRRIDIVRTLLDVVNLKSDWFRANKMEMTTRFDRPLFMIDGDEDLLGQVFVNIITNAQQAMSEGGDGSRFLIDVREEDKMVRLSFHDDGPGIDSRDLPRIFDPFYTTREVGRGSGLGLSMAYRIVHEHGGQIRAESTPGDGTTFTVELPLANPQPFGVSEERPAPILAPHAGGRVLVVDDEPMVTELIARSLTEQGYHIDIASRGAEVVGRTDLDTYDLLLLDVKMPGIGGADLFDTLRRQSGNIATRVVVMTGDTASIATQEFIERTGNPVLAKPFTLEQLMNTVSDFIAESTPGENGCT